MNKFKSAVLYECSTKIKAMCVFYLIEYAIVAISFAMAAVSSGGAETYSNGLEFCSVFFVSVIGVLGYEEDFKALIQNGYTRKYIYLSTICMFLFLSVTMALIDTTIGNTIHYFNSNYFTFFGSIYGYGNPLGNWLWLTVLYLLFCCLFYLGVLIIRKAGKMVSLFIGVGLCGVVIIVISLFRFVISHETAQSIAEFLMKAMGFMGDGSVNLLFPIITLLTMAIVLGAGSYAIIRRTELK